MMINHNVTPYSQHIKAKGVLVILLSIGVCLVSEFLKVAGDKFVVETQTLGLVV